MSAKRGKKKVRFKNYDGMVKRGEGKGSRWVCIGAFDSVENARDAGATKCVPRYARG